MDFESAVSQVRAALKVARKSWDQGKYVFRDPKNPAVPGDPGYLSIQSAEGSVQEGWTPSKEDKDANDWHVIS